MLPWISRSTNVGARSDLNFWGSDAIGLPFWLARQGRPSPGRPGHGVDHEAAKLRLRTNGDAGSTLLASSTTPAKDIWVQSSPMRAKSPSGDSVTLWNWYSDFSFWFAGF